MKETSSVRSQVSEEEWQTRVDLAACYRLVAQFGMTDLIYNHITARVPGTDDQFLINRYGLFYEEVTASNLIKIDLEGNILSPTNTPDDLNYAGYVIHSAIHGARHDVDCVLHTHTKAGIAVASMKCGLLPLTQTAMRFQGRVGVHLFEGPAVEDDEKARLVADLGPHDVLMLPNHGLLTCGRTIPEAFLLMQRLETACQLQLAMLSTTEELISPTDEVIEKSRRIVSPPGSHREGNEAKLGDQDGQREWKALLRRLSTIDDSWRT